MDRNAVILKHEERVTRDPYSLKSWLSYLSHISATPHPTLFQVFERAVAALPGSYKLWRKYTCFFRVIAAKYHPDHPAREAALSVSLRAAKALRVSPVLWKEAVEDLMREGRLTRMRNVLNDALRLLPVLQHWFVWDVVLEGVIGGEVGMPVETSLLILRRYAKLRPGGVERLFRFLVKAQRWDEAVVEMCGVLKDVNWEPDGEKTREEFWMELARVAARHPKEVVSIDVSALLRGAINRAVTDVGELWVVLGEYFIRKSLFEDARSVYEEAMGSVNVVRDFALVFDAYAKLEEGLVNAAIEDVEVITEENEDEAELTEAKQMVELLIARLEFLTERRPMLLSDVWLRQNPHNVHEWHKRARLFKHAKDAVNVVDTYTKAVQTVDCWRATNGRPHTLWLAFARYYEDAKDLSSARRVLEKSVSDPEGFRSAEDLAAVWCEYAEMELRCTTPEKARNVLLRATQEPDKIKREEAKRERGETNSNFEAVKGAGGGNVIVEHIYDNASPAWKSYKSMRVWHFLIDLTQSIGTTDEVTKLHHKMFELRIASPLTIISGAKYLESKRLFEQAFRLYDKGVSALSWPTALQVWVVYLKRFVKRFGSRKLERGRDLFEEAIRSAPATRKGGHNYAHPQLRLLYIMYAKMEEEHSLARHALGVLSRASQAVREEDRADMYRLYIVKTTTLFGVTKTRPIYEEALSSLANPEDILEFATRFAAMETRLGEFDRARGVYTHACQIADPRRKGFFEFFWKSWNDFELNHGSEDSFRDMLREKRSVQLNHKGVIVNDDVLDDITNDERRGIRHMVKDTDTFNGEALGVPDDGRVTGEEEKSLEAAVGEDGGSPGCEKDDVDKESAAHLPIVRETNIDGNNISEVPETGSEMNGPPNVRMSVLNQNDGDLKMVQKELPEALRKLVGAAHSRAQKRKREEDENGVDNVEAILRSNENEKVGNGEDVNGAGENDKPLGALERIKRSRASATN